MADYLLQPDGASTCCDCPDRVSPCDDCESDCPLPDGLCPHVICVEFKLDSADTSGKDILEVTNGIESNGFGFYFDGTNWAGYGFDSGSGAVLATDPFDTWHTVKVEITKLNTSTRFAFYIDDVAAFSFDNSVTADAGDFSKIFVGAYNGGGDAHRSFRKVTALGNPDFSEPGFSFPTGSFSALVGGASIDGDGNLRIDDTSDAYGRYDLPNDWNLDCACQSAAVSVCWPCGPDLLDVHLCGGGADSLLWYGTIGGDYCTQCWYLTATEACSFTDTITLENSVKCDPLGDYIPVTMTFTFTDEFDISPGQFSWTMDLHIPSSGTCCEFTATGTGGLHVTGNQGQIWNTGFGAGPINLFVQINRSTPDDPPNCIDCQP